MKIRFAATVFALLLCFCSYCFSADNGNGIIVISPVNNSLVEVDALVIQGRARQGTEILYSLKNSAGQNSQSVQAEWGDIFEIFTLLAPGLNTIEINGEKIEVFFAYGGLAPPGSFLSRRLHSGDISRCDNCHINLINIDKFEIFKRCLNCHIITSENPDNQEDPATSRHFRVSTAECGLCHEAHSSVDSKLLKASPDEICGGCHPREMREMEKETSHLAFKERGCATCHDPHYSGYDKVLKKPLPDLCRECHDVAIDISAENLHSALKQERSCVSCHNPHGSAPNLLRAEESVLCAACHPQIMEAGHGKTLGACLKCHDPHGLYVDGMLKSSAQETCEKCHPEATAGTVVHPPAARGCRLCHKPHKNNDAAQAAFICPSCHTVGESDWDSLHGSLDIPLEKCGLCHPPHSSNQPTLVNAKMHFPLTQGKCTICHGGGEGVKIQEVERRCRMCHPFEQEMKARGATIHEPVDEGLCPQCHEPHMSDLPRFLTQPITDLCLECHDDLDSDPNGPHKNLSEAACISCHSAHGGENQYFLK